MSQIYKGTIEEITEEIVCKSGFKKREIILKQNYGGKVKLQVHPSNYGLIEHLREGIKAHFITYASEAGKSGTNNIIINGVKL